MNTTPSSNITEPYQHLSVNIAILSVYLVVGAIGNILVLVVYKSYLTPLRDERYFIPFLAASDLFATVFGALSNGIWDYLSFNFTNSALCKSLLFLLSVTAYLSILILECIAIQRYLLICRLHNLNARKRRVMIFMSFIGAICLAAPFSVIFDINDIYSDGHMIGTRCGRSKAEKLYTPGYIYAISFGTLMVLTVLSLVFLYGRVGNFIYRQFNSKKCKEKFGNSSCDTIDKTSESKSDLTVQTKDICTHKEDTAEPISIISIKFTESKTAPETNNEAKTQTQELLKEPSKGFYLSTDTPSNTPTNLTPAGTPKHGKSNIRKRNKKFRNKFSTMFIIITTVSLICYMPVGVIVVLEGIMPDFWDGLSKTEFAVVAWLYHTYIINSVVNPIIYAFLDTEFQAGLKKLFCK